MNSEFEHQTHKVDVCVVGGGMAGLIAAVAAARRGASVVLIHDRSVLGGNASSEVRMWICGAHGAHKKETGILEEIQLANRLRNPTGLYSVWDSVLFEFAKMTPGLTTLLNCTCNDGRVEDGRLIAINAWQLSNQTWHTVEAKVFIDSSGDSILAPIAGAETRHGRESRDEFGESIAPRKADVKTMGNSVLMQLEETHEPQDFQPPAWAYSFDENSTLPSRVGNGTGHNFWWIELGGLQNTISDAETIRDELVKCAWGIWDYMKNRGPQSKMLRNWRMSWMGSVPGKRENRRYVGPHVLTQHDISAGGAFSDLVAYGGWSMDDHHPAGLLYPGKATLFHPAPSPYGIPLSVLYSRNVPNLFCAGRNISATHCALSSTRVMATCAVIGQAVGTAAALCIRNGVLPSELGEAGISELQAQLMEDDCWLPGFAKPVQSATLEASLEGNSEDLLENLRNGHERPIDGVDHAWEAPEGSTITLRWQTPRKVEALRLVLDSDLNDSKKMPCIYKLDAPPENMPKCLVRDFKIEVQRAGDSWETIHFIKNNARRLVVLPLQGEVTAIRLTGIRSWGEKPIRVFSMEACDTAPPLTLDIPKGKSWVEIVEARPDEDLAVPDHGLEEKSAGSGRFGA